MGNAVALSRGAGRVKIMKLDGEVLWFKSPVTVGQLLQDYPNHVILHSDAVRHVGVRAKPLEGSTQLKPKQLYFLLQLPLIENLRAPGRVRSEINMSAKSRLEAMLLARRSSSDISALTSSSNEISVNRSPSNGEDGAVRVKVRMSKAQLAQLTLESANSSETATKILDLCLNEAETPKNETCSEILRENQGVGNSRGSNTNAARKRVCFSSDVQTAQVFSAIGN